MIQEKGRECAGIYQIICKANGRSYIGYSGDILKRFDNHRAKLNTGKHPNKDMVNDWQRYGSQSFKFKILERIKCKKERKAREAEILSNRKSRWKMYNKIFMDASYLRIMRQSAVGLKSFYPTLGVK